MILSLHKALENIGQEIPSWREFKPEDIKMMRSMGTSNQTYIFESKFPDIEPIAVIYRIFGKGIEEYFTDRTFENIIYSIVSDYSLGPNIYITHDIYRIEEYFQANVLSYEKMLEFQSIFQITRSLALMHSIKVDYPKLAEPRLTSLLNNKKLQGELQEKINQIKSMEEYKHLNWDSLNEWLMIKGNDNLKEMVETLPKEYILSHNDLNSNNILICKDNGHFKLIDFEYSDFSWKAYDLANYLNETHFDYSLNKSPFFFMKELTIPKVEANALLCFYLIFEKVGKSQESEYWKETKILFEELKTNNFNETLISQLLEKYGVTDEDINEFQKQVQNCMILSNYYWMIWSIFIGHDKSKDFDYIMHAWNRFEFMTSLTNAQVNIFK